MAKKRRRTNKHAAQPERLKQIGCDIISGTISGLIVLAVTKLLNW